MAKTKSFYVEIKFQWAIKIIAIRIHTKYNYIVLQYRWPKTNDANIQMKIHGQTKLLEIRIRKKYLITLYITYINMRRQNVLVCVWK